MRIAILSLAAAAVWVLAVHAQDTLTTYSANSKQGAIAFEAIGGPGNYTFQIARRDGRAGSEVHKCWTYVLAVQAGEATINYGGEIENLRERDKAVDDGELRGTGLLRSKSRKVVPGEVVLIPAGVPYQIMVDPGKTFSFFVVKMQKK